MKIESQGFIFQCSIALAFGDTNVGLLAFGAAGGKAG